MQLFSDYIRDTSCVVSPKWCAMVVFSWFSNVFATMILRSRSIIARYSGANEKEKSFGSASIVRNGCVFLVFQCVCQIGFAQSIPYRFLCGFSQIVVHNSCVLLVF